MTPGGPALCVGTVHHRRLTPAEHTFQYPVSYVWFDPDAPDTVACHHPLWSASHLAPARFRASDFGDGSGRPLGDQARDDLADLLGTRPAGPVRMLTQWRRWGWLFNPITVYLVWNADGAQGLASAETTPSAHEPVGVVLEVTNTPWKERHRYAARLTADVEGSLVAEIDKVLHVSPFLDEEYRYHVTLANTPDASAIRFGIDVLARATDELVLATGLVLDRRPVDRSVLGDALRSERFPTHRVSAGIHRQAARLWRRHVPFVTHPRKRADAHVG